jgi:DNA replication and repair protein RecF
MSLAELTVENLRCLQHASLKLHSGHNLIWGGNGSGKTSLLEAVFLLGRGRSFRIRNSERLIRHAEERLVVFGRSDGAAPQTLGIQVSRRDGTVAKIGGSFVQSLAELSRSFAVQVIEPGIHRLVEEGGHRRRRWLDWAVFHVEPGFIDAWSSYTRALKQRNAALRIQANEVGAWDPELARLGEIISDSRRSFVESLQPYWRRAAASLLGFGVELGYVRGWVQGLALSEALIASRDRDAARGITHAGPHRADIALRLNGKPARELLSRGEQKLVAIAMTLAQLNLIQDLTGVAPMLLLDDPAAELDRRKLTQFASEIAALRCQLVVTALSADLDPLGVPDRVFHVEQGRVLHV